MAITGADEDIHPQGQGEHYGENYLFAGLADSSDTGFYLHVGRLFGIGTYELHVATFADGVMYSSLVREDLDPGSMRHAGLSYEIVEPMREWRLAFTGTGRSGAFLGGSEPAVTPVGFDLSFRSSGAPFDMAGLFRKASFGQMLGEHYEQGFRWDGDVTVGDRVFTVSGLGIRDHSWGSRHMTAHNTTWWAPSAFDDGDVFYASLDMRRGDHRMTFSSRTDAGGGSDVYDEFGVTVLEGDQVTYRQADLVFGEHGPFRAIGIARVTVPWLIGHGLLRVSDDLFCRLERPDGLPGFCLLEMNRAMTRAEQLGFGVTADRRANDAKAAPATEVSLL